MIIADINRVSKHENPAEADSGARPFTRVLVVDDEPAACKLFSTFLERPTIRCVTASSGEEALLALSQNRFDAIISDLRMPGISGVQLLTEARRRDPHVAFLVVTGVDEVEVGVEAMRAGADDYLVKPIIESVVLNSLERALHKQFLEKQLEGYRQLLEKMVAERTSQLQDALGKLEHSYESTLEALGAAIDLRDNETAGHSRRVRLYSNEIARGMGLSDEAIKKLARGAYLHDIGKLGVPDRILLKPGPLSTAEWKIMKEHVQIGFDLVKEIPFLEDAAQLILTHHERFDGKGYPHGLKGDEIPLETRVFAVADALDAITSDRPYRRASSFEAGRDAIHRLAGCQFDPRVVEEFLKIPADRWATIAGS